MEAWPGLVQGELGAGVFRLLGREQTQSEQQYRCSEHQAVDTADTALRGRRPEADGHGAARRHAVLIADEAVREFVGNSNDAGRLTVVSSDIEVVRACKLSGAKIIPSQAMAARLAGLAPAEQAAPERPEKPLRGMIGKLEREMLDEIGDPKEFERRVLEGE